MAIIPIHKIPDTILREKAKRVKTINNSVKQLIEDMIETMHSASGLGLAAPQIGVPLRVIVIGIPGEEEIALINPKIIRRKGERLVSEGCLSIPGYRGQVKRAESVKVKGLDRYGKEVRLKTNELLAQAIEHEIDHINGVLYIDHLDSLEDLVKIDSSEDQGESI
jgi:peptide deformylase